MGTDGSKDGSTAAAESDLCTSCGMCCDGTYMAWVRLVPGDDIGRLTVLHPEHTDEGKHFFVQPCAALEGTRCSVYTDRPTVCRSYRCQLLDRTAAGEHSVQRAAELITQARQLADRIKPQMIERTGTTEPAGLIHLYGPLEEHYNSLPEPDAARLADADLLFDITAFRRLIDRHFAKPQQSAPSDIT